MKFVKKSAIDNAIVVSCVLRTQVITEGINRLDPTSIASAISTPAKDGSEVIIRSKPISSLLGVHEATNRGKA